MSMTIMPGNYFMSHLILTLFEIPSVFVGLTVTHYFGRRFLAFSSLFLCGICCIVAPFCVDHMWKLIAVLAVLKLAVSCTLYLVFLLPSEILPTPVRTSGAGLTVVSGMLGMTFAPYLLQTFLEGEELGRGRPLTSWIHKWNVHKYPAAPPHHTKEEVQDLMNGKA
ncbi:Solute carrier family 22 member 3 [Portunus trituberculatus]|uniref:Solute carrier family 22 member 3 n=1 Tax=Portunus trituberculatus TaxID=210409 RepID=A0A5B7H4B1_PORTR|nr:Solute carrier family 22 member 3 [Portunus trituberculatus]